MILNYQNRDAMTATGQDRRSRRLFRLASFAVIGVLAVFTVAALNSEGPAPGPRVPTRSAYEQKLANDQAMQQAADRIWAERGNFVVGGER
jgi:hypothetical protein